VIDFLPQAVANEDRPVAKSRARRRPKAVAKPAAGPAAGPDDEATAAS
jgi:hypothetical protein